MTNNIDALDIKNQKPVDSSNDSLAPDSKRWTISTQELANKSSSLYLRLGGRIHELIDWMHLRKKSIWSNMKLRIR
jgi:hypothetical protein